MPDKPPRAIDLDKPHRAIDLTTKVDTFIGIVLDRSASMNIRKQETIKGFNDFLKAQQDEPGKAIMTLIQFDNEYEVLADFQPLTVVKPLTEATYEPRACTALLDALGRTIIKAGDQLRNMKEEDRPAKVIFVVISDGEENASQEFDGEKIKEMITHQQEKYSWEFVFMGCDQDSFEVAEGLGIIAANAYNFGSQPKAMSAAFSVCSANIASYRSSGSTLRDGGHGSATIGSDDKDEATTGGTS